MRDGQILAMQHQSARRDSLMFAQFEFLKTRQEAFEMVLKVSTIWQRLRWAFDPIQILTVVDAVQMQLLNEAKRQMQAASKKNKILTPVKSPIQIVTH